MKTKNIIVSGAIATMLLTGGSVFAKRPDFAGRSEHGQRPSQSNTSRRPRHQNIMPNGPAFRRAQLALKLNLTSDQSEKIKEIHSEARESRQAVVNQIVVNRQQIKPLVHAEPYDETAIQTLADTQGDLFSQLIVIRANSKAAVLALLTDEQKAILEKEKPSDADVAGE